MIWFGDGVGLKSDHNQQGLQYFWSILDLGLVFDTTFCGDYGMMLRQLGDGA